MPNRGNVMEANSIRMKNSIDPNDSVSHKDVLAAHLLGMTIDAYSARVALLKKQVQLLREDRHE